MSVDRRRRTDAQRLGPWPSLWRAPIPPPPLPAYERAPAAQQWLRQAACRDGSVDMFPDGDTAGVTAAQAVCGGCPVKQPCAALLAALPPAWREYGVWAGSTPNHRRTRRPVTLSSIPAEEHAG